MTAAGHGVGRTGSALRHMVRRRIRALRWAALGLAGLVVVLGISELRHAAVPRREGVPAVVARKPLRPGQMIGAADIRLSALTPALRGEPTFGRPEEAIGRVVLRELHPGDLITAGNAVPVLRYYGVAARVPPGMRAFNVIVSGAEAFGGELTPLSRVDLLGAFEVGQERAAITLLTSGIILRVTPRRDSSAFGDARPAGSSGDGAAAETGVVEITVAVPGAHEREIALARAFGRIYLAVHPASAETSPGAAPGALRLGTYLGLPAEPGLAVSGLRTSPPVPRGVPPRAPARPNAAGGSLGAGGHSGSLPARRPREPVTYQTSPPALPGASPGPSPWTVEIIDGVERTVETVPRAGEPGTLEGGER